MKSKIKWILLAAGLVVVIAGAAVLYRVLSANYSGENLMQSAQAQGAVRTGERICGARFYGIRRRRQRGAPFRLQGQARRPQFLGDLCAITARRKCRISTGRMKNTGCAVPHGERHRRHSGRQWRLQRNTSNRRASSLTFSSRHESTPSTRIRYPDFPPPSSSTRTEIW